MLVRADVGAAVVDTPRNAEPAGENDSPKSTIAFNAAIQFCSRSAYSGYSAAYAARSIG